MTDYESDVENFDEINIEHIQLNIINTMQHLIFCDLTTGRTDDGLEPYDLEQVNNFINNNIDNIELAAATMFATYEEENDIRSLLNPPIDWFRDFLYEFVKTRTIDTDEDDDHEDYNNEHSFEFYDDEENEENNEGNYEGN